MCNGVLLTSTEDIIGQWKEYFEDLLSPTDMPSVHEAESRDAGGIIHPSLGVRSRMAETLGWMRVNLRFKRSNMMDQLFMVSRILECASEFSQSVYISFVDSEKDLSQGSPWEGLQVYGASVSRAALCQKQNF